MSAPERLPYEELRKRYGTGDIVYWGRRVLGFERDDPMTCPNCDPLATENAALRERVAQGITVVLTPDDVLTLIHALSDPSGLYGYMVGDVGIEVGLTDEELPQAYLWIMPGDLDAAPGGEGGTDGQ